MKELKGMEDWDTIEPSISKWPAPIVVVGKKDVTLRLCADYRWWNSVTCVDAYPMPQVDELLDGIGQAWYITTLDFTRGYWQVPV